MSMFAMVLNSSPAMCGDPPGLVEPKFSVPGFARASASSSCRFFAGTDGCTVSTLGVFPTMVIGAKSFTAS